MTHFILSSWWKIIALCWKLITFQINNLWVGKLASLIPPLALCRFIISQSCCPLKPRAQDLLFEKPEWLYAQKEWLRSSVTGMHLNVWDKSLGCPKNAWVACVYPSATGKPTFCWKGGWLAWFLILAEKISSIWECHNPGNMAPPQASPSAWAEVCVLGQHHGLNSCWVALQSWVTAHPHPKVAQGQDGSPQKRG